MENMISGQKPLAAFMRRLVRLKRTQSELKNILGDELKNDNNKDRRGSRVVTR